MPKPNKGGGDSNVISGNKRDNVLIGSDADEILDGKGGNDRLISGGGNDTVYGGSGTDTVVFTYARDDYDVTLLSDGSIQVSGPEGTDTISGVEVFEFADMTQSAAEVILPRLANLTAGTLEVEDVSLSPGETTDIHVDVASNGVIDAAESTVELLIASAPDDAAVISTVGTAQLGATATGTSGAVSFSFDPGSLEPGTYWVAVRVDSTNSLDEESEADNQTEWVQITVEAPSTDLQLVSATVDGSSDLDLEGGARIQMNYVIHDASNIDVSYFRVATYISTDGTISVDDHRIAGITGGTYSGLTTSPSTSHWLQEDYAPGDYYLISLVEWGDGTADTQLDNNTIVQTITLTPPPEPTVDISVGTVSIEASSDFDLGPNDFLGSSAGARLDLEFDVSNLGTGPAINAGFTAYLSTDGMLSADDIEIWTGTASLQAGGTTTLTAAANIDGSVAAGDYQVILVSDAPSDVDATNNSAAADVTLVGGVAVGTEADDVWVSGTGGDIVDLLGGDDFAFAGPGFDMVDGGAGVDTLDFSSSTEGVGLYSVVSNSYELIEFSPTSGQTASVYTNFERMVTTDHDDQVDLSGSTIHDLQTGAGNDLIIGSDGDDTIDAGLGDDLIVGGLGNDLLITGDGNDMIGVVHNTSAGAAKGFGHDVVDDFDFNFDSVVIEVGVGETYDPLLDLVQTSDGALLQYAEDSSLLLKGVDLDDLGIDHFLITEGQTDIPVDF
ncbi:CARDB domain-containing protein [Ruegeria atlantica]|uniref:CARDB domain-containing protein n=1 Tax=Ruegeria atlantica TaxID=81569 RepID=UPI00147D5C43|nr:CARDB domain-containing protein [Ruegeria atlantica]